MSFAERSRNVRTREEFVDFVRSLANDFDEKRILNWENTTVDAYIWSIGRWTAHMDEYFIKRGVTVPEPSWELFAIILATAAIYE